jgi:hypothetical protein
MQLRFIQSILVQTRAKILHKMDLLHKTRQSFGATLTRARTTFGLYDISPEVLADLKRARTNFSDLCHKSTNP